MKIACSMPGKLGDLLYSLPTVRHISKILGEKIDFWTSNYCSSAVELLKKQSYINEVFIAQNYQIQHDQCGLQPWLLKPEKDYDRIYHMGFRHYPQGRLVDYFSDIHGFTLADKTIKYDFEPLTSPGGYKVVSPGRNPILKPIFGEIIKHFVDSGNVVVQIGPPDELINIFPTININGMYESLAYLNNCDFFFGTLSANLVLANGFPCKKIVLCEKERHNPAHDIQSDSHNYIDCKSSMEEIMKCVT